MSHEHTQPAPKPTPTPCEALKCPKPRGAEAHCAACHNTFTTNGTFDRHRRATQCLNPHTATRSNREPIFEARTRRDGRTVYGYPGTWNPEAAA